MITIVILGILAAVTIPAVTGHIEKAEDVAAQVTYTQARKAIDLYYDKHNGFPADLTTDMFSGKDKVHMPRGWQLHYWPLNGRLELIELAPEDVDGAPDVIVMAGV